MSESTTTAFDATTVPAVEPSSKFNSAAVDVTPSRIFNSAAVDVTPSSIFSSAAVDVTPSNILSSAVVEVTPSSIFNSAAVEVTPSSIFNSAAVEVTPSSIFNSAPVEVIVVPPKVSEPDISTLPFMSTVVAAICISVSATKSNCPSAEELIYIAVSLNCSFSVVLINISSENWK